jgi:hypothetical protein
MEALEIFQKEKAVLESVFSRIFTEARKDPLIGSYLCQELRNGNAFKFGREIAWPVRAVASYEPHKYTVLVPVVTVVPLGFKVTMNVPNIIRDALLNRGDPYLFRTREVGTWARL